MKLTKQRTRKGVCVEVLRIVSFGPVCGAMSGAGSAAVEREAAARQKPAPYEVISNKDRELASIYHKLGISRYQFEGKVPVNVVLTDFESPCCAWRWQRRATHPANLHAHVPLSTETTTASVDPGVSYRDIVIEGALIVRAKYRNTCRWLCAGCSSWVACCTCSSGPARVNVSGVLLVIQMLWCTDFLERTLMI